MSAVDIRIDVKFVEHFKTQTLLSECGPEGIMALIKLWSWAAQERPLGALKGLKARNIEALVRWPKERAGELVQLLVELRFLDLDEDGVYHIHNWARRQPWVMESHVKSAEGKFHSHRGKALKRGCSEAEAVAYAHSLVPEFAALTGRTLEADIQKLNPAQGTLPGVPDAGEEVRETRRKANQAAAQAKAKRAEQGGQGARTSGRRKFDPVAFCENHPAPSGVDSQQWTAFIEVAAAGQVMTSARAQTLTDACMRVKAEGGDANEVLKACVEGGWSSITVTWSMMRQRQAIAVRDNFARRPGESDAQRMLRIYKEKAAASGTSERFDASASASDGGAALSLVALGHSILKNQMAEPHCGSTD